MGGWLFLGGFLAVAVGIAVIYFIIRGKLRGFSRRVFGNPNILDALEGVDSIEDQSPRSLNACDSLLLPQILRDFPDFDVNYAKTVIRNYLKEKLGAKEGYTFHRIAIARYLPTQVQKTIVFQAAVSYRENGKTQQKRYDLHYSYILSSGDPAVAANCPNCGGALGFSQTVCPYCGSRVANPLGNVWKVTDMIES